MCLFFKYHIMRMAIKQGKECAVVGRSFTLAAIISYGAKKSLCLQKARGTEQRSFELGKGSI